MKRAIGSFSSLVLLSLAALPAQNLVQKSVPEASSRGNARIFYWGGNESAGQVTIDYGTPKWTEAFDQQWQRLAGKRWRLGQNHWTNLDTNMDLTIAGVDVPAGHYYLTLDGDAEGNYWLTLLDPAAQRAAKRDAYHAHHTTGGIRVPMEHRRDAHKTADSLLIHLARRGMPEHRAVLAIHFGPHHLTAPLEMHPALVVPAPERGDRLPDAVRAVLENAHAMEVFALDPSPGGGDRGFHGYAVLGRTDVSSLETRRDLLALVYAGVAGNDGKVAACFNPRHGIRATRGEHVAELQICFECLQIRVFLDGKRVDSVLTAKSVEPKVSAIYRTLGLEISK